jgi:hypothetical protein
MESFPDCGSGAIFRGGTVHFQLGLFPKNRPKTSVSAPVPVKNERFLKIVQKNEVFSRFLASK